MELLRTFQLKNQSYEQCDMAKHQAKIQYRIADHHKYFIRINLNKSKN
jgi:hypothetical protein